MDNVLHDGPVSRAAKRLLPGTARLFSSHPAQSAIWLSETAAAMLQGKGAGSGWDIAGEVAAAMRFLRPGAVVFDVGANVGDWSRAILSRLDGQARLFLFEPQESCHAQLAGLVGGGAVLTKAAVGKTDGSATLYSPGDLAGNASLHVRKDTYFDKQVFAPRPVELVSIDSFMRRHEIAHVDFMKMDIEGHEVFALEGAADAIAAGTIRALSFEFGSGNLNSRTFFRDFWELLTPKNYTIYRVLPGGRLVAVRQYQEDLEYFRGVTNYIAAREPPAG